MKLLKIQAGRSFGEAQAPQKDLLSDSITANINRIGCVPPV